MATNTYQCDALLAKWHPHGITVEQLGGVIAKDVFSRGTIRAHHGSGFIRTERSRLPIVQWHMASHTVDAMLI